MPPVETQEAKNKLAEFVLNMPLLQKAIDSANQIEQEKYRAIVDDLSLFFKNRDKCALLTATDNIEIERLQKEYESLKSKLPPPQPVAVTAKSSVMNELIAAYKKAYNKDPRESAKDKSPVFDFPNPTEASNFFDAQAKAGKSFLCQKVNEKDEPAVPEEYMFSCGDNKLYKGDRDTIIKALDAASTIGSPEEIQKVKTGLAEFQKQTMKTSVQMMKTAVDNTAAVPAAKTNRVC